MRNRSSPADGFLCNTPAFLTQMAPEILNPQSLHTDLASLLDGCGRLGRHVIAYSINSFHLAALDSAAAATKCYRRGVIEKPVAPVHGPASRVSERRSCRGMTSGW